MAQASLSDHVYTKVRQFCTQHGLPVREFMDQASEVRLLGWTKAAVERLPYSAEEAKFLDPDKGSTKRKFRDIELEPANSTEIKDIESVIERRVLEFRQALIKQVAMAASEMEVTVDGTDGS